MPNKRITIVVLLLIASLPAISQGGFDVFLNNMLSNNKDLSAARELAGARKASAYTGIYLPNPEASFDLLSSPVGSYSEALVTQRFDFPNAYKHRREMAGISAQQTGESLRQTQLERSMEAANAFAGAILVNRKLLIQQQRAELLDTLVAKVEKKLERGAATIFEAERIRLASAQLSSEIRLLENSRLAQMRQLALLNGGLPFEVTDTSYANATPEWTPENLSSDLTASHPQSRYWETEARLAESDVALQRSLRLPGFEAGVRQDFNLGQAYFGFRAGVRIPLFENKNTVEAAAARERYVREELSAWQTSFENALAQQAADYQALKETTGELAQAVSNLESPSLLIRAYEAGQIDYAAFFQGWDSYYQAVLYLEDLLGRKQAIGLQLYALNRFAR